VALSIFVGRTEPAFVNVEGAQKSIPQPMYLGGKVRQIKGCRTGAGVLARNQVGIGLSYRPARLHRLAEFIPWNQSLGSINV
jgi:hypothetical protein